MDEADGANTSAAGGRPPKNKRSIRWRDRLEAIWKERPSLRIDDNELHRRAALHGGTAVRKIEDFREKLNGNRPASPEFERALFLATGLERLGVGLADWQGSEEVFAACLTTLQNVDFRSILSRSVTDDRLKLRVDSEPELLARTRRVGVLPENKVRVGEYMVLTLEYLGSDAMRTAHVALFEFDYPEGQVQVISSLANVGISHRTPVSFKPAGNGLEAKARLKLPVVEPKGTFDMFALVSHKPFDHRIVAILDNLESTSGMMTEVQLNQLARLLESKQKGVIVAALTFQSV